MSVAAILAIMAIGIILIALEIFVIPGTTIFGVIGGLILFGGVYLVYRDIGTSAGHYALAGAVFLTIASTYWGFKVVQSHKFSLNEVIDGKVNVLADNGIKVGDIGRTLSVLRPNGKARINEQKIEVYSQSDYIDVDTEVQVVVIDRNKIIVKPV